MKEDAGSFDFVPARRKNHPFIIAQSCKMLIQCMCVCTSQYKLPSDKIWVKIFKKNKKMKNLIFFLVILEAYQITESDRCPAIRGKSLRRVFPISCTIIIFLIGWAIWASWPDELSSGFCWSGPAQLSSAFLRKGPAQLAQLKWLIELTSLWPSQTFKNSWAELSWASWANLWFWKSSTHAGFYNKDFILTLRPSKSEHDDPSRLDASKTWSHGSFWVHSAQRSFLLRCRDEPRSIRAPDRQDWNVELRAMQRESVEKWRMQFCFGYLLRNDTVARFRDSLFSESFSVAKRFPAECRNNCQSGSRAVRLRAWKCSNLRRLVRRSLRSL